MNQRRVSITTVFFISLGIFLAYLGIRRLLTTEEDRIRALFATVERGLEARNPATCLSTVSTKYRDSRGRSAADLRTAASRFCLATRQVFASVNPQSIRINGDRAQAQLSVSIRAFYGSQEVDVTTEQGTEVVRVFLQKENNEWKVISASFPPEVEHYLGLLTSP